MNNKDFSQSVSEAIQNIEDYYSSSFKIKPERCMPFVMNFIDKFEQITMLLTPNQQQKMQQHLLQILQGMEEQDYVLIRDVLYYEVRSLLVGLSVGKGKAKKLH